MTTLVVTRRRVETAAGGALLGTAVLVYLPLLRDLLVLWRDVPYYSYGFLVPVFAAYLAWDARGALAATPAEPTPGGLLVLGAGLSLLAAGSMMGSLTLRALSIPVTTLGLVLATQGVARTGRVAFPIGFLLFVTPLPEGAIPALSLPLQRLAAVTAEWTLRVLGAHVVRDGLYLTLPRVTLHVTEACNGLRFLLAMLVVGVAFAGLTQRRLATRVGVVVAALGLALLANVVRVTGTGVLAELWGPAAAVGLPHVAWGKVVYVLMLVPFVAVVLALRRR